MRERKSFTVAFRGDPLGAAALAAMTPHELGRVRVDYEQGQADAHADAARIRAEGRDVTCGADWSPSSASHAYAEAYRVVM